MEIELDFAILYIHVCRAGTGSAPAPAWPVLYKTKNGEVLPAGISQRHGAGSRRAAWHPPQPDRPRTGFVRGGVGGDDHGQIGRASCRERVWRYV